MMAKITKGSDHGGVVRYVMQEKKNAELIDSKDALTTSKQSIIDSFRLQCLLNPKVSVVVGHISLNFSAEDTDSITNEFMRHIAQEYMHRMNIQNTQYILVRHYDREHPHCHLVFNRIDNNGKVITDKNDRLRSTKICRELTEEYGLHIATGKEHVKRERLKEPDATRYRIYDILIEAVPKCKDWNELRSALARKCISVSFTYRGSTTDIQGIVFNMNGFRFNGSKIDRRFSYSKISGTLRQNQRQISNGMKENISSSNRPQSSSRAYEHKQSHSSVFDGTAFENKRNSSHKAVGTGTISSPLSGVASIVLSAGSSIVSRIGHTMMAASATPNTSPAGGCGGSSPDDLSDDEYIDEYGVLRKKKRGLHR